MATEKKHKKTDETPETTTVATVPTPGALSTSMDYGDDEGAGFENQTAADLSIPFITVLQPMSPQCVKRVHPMAQPGNLYNTVTETYYDMNIGILIVPATTRRMFAKWVPRDEGGGFRGHLDPDDPDVLDAKKRSINFGKYRVQVPNPKQGDGQPEKVWLQLTETFYVYGVQCSEDGRPEGMVAVANTSSKITDYKKWMTRIRNVTLPPRQGSAMPIVPPLYAHLTRLKSRAESNVKGDFFVFDYSPGDPRGLMQSLLLPTDPRFVMGRSAREMVDSGAAKADYARQGQDEAEVDGEQPF
jgi:hypothetical protein